jgi:hypothetical protein
MTPEHAETNARIDALQAQVDALTARLDYMIANEPDDPTQRIAPIPEQMMPHLPPLPEGKTEWVGRGRFEGLEIYAEKRHVAYFINSTRGLRCERTNHFSDAFFHIEAV